MIAYRRLVLLYSTLIVTVCLSTLAQDPLIEQAEKDPDFKVQGEYLGPSRGLQVVALGDGDFDVVVFEGGLPGGKWNRVKPRRLELGADEVADLAESNDMKRVVRKSPTLGLKPPADAVVLFDGGKQSLENWKGGKLSPNGHLAQGTTSKESFQDFSAHIEFRTPYKPNARGQARGNSGIYYQGRYETQVLDSFGLEGKMNETGGIYSIRAPDLNMCFPPLTWQTYDVDFTAARFDAQGKKVAPARLTVRLNGVVVQQDVKLTHSTTASPLKEGPEPGPIYLQDHSNPVEFRNIWVVPKDAAAEARRPILPGYERFFANAVTRKERVQGGALLINDLGCANCHAVDQGRLTELTGVTAKAAPILDSVGSRVRPEYLFDYLLDTHAAKPGATMPVLMGHLDQGEREQAAKALTSFLMTTGKPVLGQGQPKAVGIGKKIYHSVGCTACHAPQDGTQVTSSTSISLDAVPRKYTLASLTAFLENPHAVRTGGRMPKLVEGEDAANVATYLLRDVAVGTAINVKAKFYRGDWEQLPNFDQLKPVSDFECYGFDIQLYGKRLEQFGARFDSHVMIPQKGKYKFFVSSDDGSRILVDGKEIANADGVHPTQTKAGTIELEAGAYPIRVEYFEKGGQEVLRVEIEGPGLRRRPLETMLTLDPEGKESDEDQDESSFKFEQSLVAKGRELFTSVGCANCHQLKVDDWVAPSRNFGLALTSLKGESQVKGCLSSSLDSVAPRFDLNSVQREHIRLALNSLGAGDGSFSPNDTIHVTMATMNCYACHSHGAIGGPEASRDVVFQTTTKEMGEEGRLPPPLDGAGDKLRPDYIRQILAEGANERDYMLVSMPGFGDHILDGLAANITQVDMQSGAELVKLAGESEERIKANGRLLAGSRGLSCIKCHTAGGKGTGIQAIDMQRMSTRLNEDWFHRYLMEPTTYRPGTRMPASFPDGKSVLPELYGGEPPKQLAALWAYLKDGSKAALPIGAEARLIELVSDERPVLYRNFLSDLTPRGIGVGFPEGGNMAWDANRMSLTLIWKGAFMDASRHWTGRGQGNQPPLGDQVLKMETAAPIAVLDTPTAKWPTEAERSRGYRFLGYRLNKVGQPAFRYRIGELEVEDFPHPISVGNSDVEFRRELSFTGGGDSGKIVFRLKSRGQIEISEDGWLTLVEGYQTKIDGGKLVLTGSEARVTVDAKAPNSLTQWIRW